MLDGGLAAHQLTVTTFDLPVWLPVPKGYLGDDDADDHDGDYDEYDKDDNDDDDDKGNALSRRECGRGPWGVGFVRTSLRHYDGNDDGDDDGDDDDDDDDNGGEVR